MADVKLQDAPTRPELADDAPRASYDIDAHAWGYEQAALLRAGRWSELDIENLADEIESVSKTEYDKLQSALTILIQHLLKWDGQPERRSRSWVSTIRVQRKHAARSLRKNPSLKAHLTEIMADAYDDGMDEAVVETGLSRKVFEAIAPSDFETLMTRTVEWPED